MTEIVLESVEDVAPREALLDLCMGEGRKAKSSERLREGRLPAEGLAFSAHGPDGRLAGTVRLWNVTAGPARPALLLGPLAVHPWFRARGLGGDMMRASIAAARAKGHGAILLVGDAAYYERFGFSGDLTRDLAMPGPVERERFLGLELRDGALSGASGVLVATGRPAEATPAAEPARRAA